VRVFVVWEPVLITDWHAPGAGAVGRIPDARVAQFWDPRHALSQAIRRGRVVWDYVAIYPAGVRWGEAFPKFSGRAGSRELGPTGAPVVRPSFVIDDFIEAIAQTLHNFDISRVAGDVHYKGESDSPLNLILTRLF
jgi:hypothetical protein